MQLPASASTQQLEAAIASEMAPDVGDGYGDEDEAPHREHILTTAARRRRQLQGLALKLGRIVSHSSDVYRDTPGVIPGASNSRDTALDRIWALGRYILSPIIAMLSTFFVQRRLVHKYSSSFQFEVADRRPTLQKIKPETKLAVSEVEVAPGIILGSLSLQDFRFITSLQYIEEH